MRNNARYLALSQAVSQAFLEVPICGANFYFFTLVNGCRFRRFEHARARARIQWNMFIIMYKYCCDGDSIDYVVSRYMYCTLGHEKITDVGTR